MDNTLKYVTGGLFGIIIGIVSGVAIIKYSGKLIPHTGPVQAGYVSPSGLEIYCKDLDNNGELETIMKFGDTEYLLKLVDGKPVVLEYNVEPAKVKLK